MNYITNLMVISFDCVAIQYNSFAKIISTKFHCIVFIDKFKRNYLMFDCIKIEIFRINFYSPCAIFNMSCYRDITFYIQTLIHLKWDYSKIYRFFQRRDL